MGVQPKADPQPVHMKVDPVVQPKPHPVVQPKADPVVQPEVASDGCHSESWHGWFVGLVMSLSPQINLKSASELSNQSQSQKSKLRRSLFTGMNLTTMWMKLAALQVPLRIPMETMPVRSCCKL